MHAMDAGGASTLEQRLRCSRPREKSALLFDCNRCGESRHQSCAGAEPLRAAQVSPGRSRLGTHICCGFLTALSESRGASWSKNHSLLSCCVCAKRIELLSISGRWRGRGISGLLLFLRQYILVIAHIVVAAFSQFCVQGRDRRRVKEWMSANLPRNDGEDRRVRQKKSEQPSRSRSCKLVALAPQNVQIAIQEQQET